MEKPLVKVFLISSIHILVKIFTILLSTIKSLLPFTYPIGKILELFALLLALPNPLGKALVGTSLELLTKALVNTFIVFFLAITILKVSILQTSTRPTYAVYAYLLFIKLTPGAYMQLPSIELRTAVYIHQSDKRHLFAVFTHLLGKRALLAAYGITTVENFLFAIVFGICFKADLLFEAKIKNIFYNV